MSRLIIAAIGVFALWLFGCGPAKDNPDGIDAKMDFRTITIEGCEYIEYDHGILDQRVYSLTHKGNCRNPIHQRP